MNGNIILHKTLGVNPRLTYCPRCGGEGRGQLLLGNRDYKTKCEHCGTMNFGTRRSEKCGNCKHPLRDSEQTPLTEYEKLPGGLCAACEEEVALHKSVVAEGGVYWKCSNCPATGVLKATAELAKSVRAQAKIEPPAPVGFEFDKDTCPVCSKVAL